MRGILAIIILLVILAIIATGWYMIEYRHKVADRRNKRLGYLRGTLQRADVLLDQYTPVDAIGHGLEQQAREVFVNYHTVLSIADSDKRRLQGAEVAHSRLSTLIAQHPQHLFAPADDASRKFVREMFSTLHPIEPKEAPHVP